MGSAHLWSAIFMVLFAGNTMKRMFDYMNIVQCMIQKLLSI